MSGRAPVGVVPRHLVRGAGVGLAALAMQWISLALWDHALDSQIIWLPGPLLLALLLCAPYRYWPAYNVGWLVGMLVLAVIVALPVHGIATVCVLVMLLINACAWGLSRLRRNPSTDSFFQLLVFLAVAVTALPAATGMSVAFLASMMDLPTWLSRPWWHIALADSLGYALLTPAILSVANPTAVLRRDRFPEWPVLLAIACALVLLWLGWRELGRFSMVRPLLLLAPVPLAIFVALRAQVVGTCVVNLLVGLIAIQLSLAQEGPFVQLESELTTMSVQLWMLGVAVASLYLAVLVEQRRTTQRALVVSSTEVRELAGRLIVAQEQERARIARDLHDDINQRLAVASIRLSALRRKVDESNKQDVSQLQSELIALSEDVRHLSHDLHPSMLTQTGLTAALAGLCQNMRHRHGPAIELRVSPHAKDLSEDVALCLYRVTQEGLSNALRYADAQCIDVSLQIAHHQVDLTITDDGKGFVTEGEGCRGLGLLSIDERTKLLGGSYRLQSTLGKGTELCIRIPLGLHGPA
ncbi:sensor histidine kinase [Dyella sp. C11]|uniref:sensor histidine kinase n=1 Tax=Dyella sp. C11 TaxID=2126991 RepID=UPI001E4B5344|nr:sensor histidine kinase [Dyella sp. C11]